ncbi:peptidase domain-containing ABC transporter [Pragia fontium]|uniref:ATP-binding cassette, subfamily B, RaxB n=1 Tax=Pragia fontium DSM 5563 = ATCC 49100 TaxID=1122977 RepID=A0AAJ5BI18_9GAMM|nr:peptidase domain-containing ABC transporter [Pragia fontium]SFD17358.1 ATP-binding cassette, subfamily B, RaxB [Pragia fontium DSM 5563 = ATCC 49100]
MNNSLFEYINKRLSFSLCKKVPQILQTESSECGLACLAMVSGYYGLNIDLFNLRQQFGISTQGATLNLINQIAAELGLKTRSLALDIDEIKQLKRPCILHWNMNHFVVLVAVRRSSFIIHDPAFGRRVIGIQELSNSFTGVALELWQDNKFEKKTQTTRVKLIELLKNIAGLKGALTKIFFLSVVVEAINLLLPVGTQLVTDHVIQARDHSLLSVICIGLLLFLLFRTFVSMIRAWISLVIGTLIDIQWKSSLFDHLMKLPLEFFEKRKLGDIQSRFGSLDSIRSTFTNSLVGGMIDSIMVVGLITMMSFYGGWLVWVVIGFTVVYSILRFATYNYYRQLSEEQIVKGAKSSSHFMETLYGISTIKALGIDKKRSNFWLNLNIDKANSNIKLTRFDMLFSGINTFLSTLDQITMLWLGALMVIENSMTLGMFMAFNAYRGQFSDRSSNLINLIMQLRMLSLHNERISDIVFTEAEKEMPERQVFQTGEAIPFEIRNLSFQYDSLSKPIFEDFNLKVEPGESVAIVGQSGVGKTTLLKVMSGLLNPVCGEIFIGGLDIHKIGLNNYRNAISCVLQEDKLFSGSIADNISGFDLQLDRELLIDCAVYSNIHEEIMSMSMGYETLIGELGTGLSGGQKQRLFIARALYRKPNIIFMDEATSHLDLDNEAFINNSISQLNITRIIVAHRPSTIASADRVVTLGNSMMDTEPLEGE